MGGTQAARAVPQQQQQQPATPPHLLQSIADFLQQLESVPASVPASSSSQFGPMPVTSPTPGTAPASGAGEDVFHACAVCIADHFKSAVLGDDNACCLQA